MVERNVSSTAHFHQCAASRSETVSRSHNANTIEIKGKVKCMRPAYTCDWNAVQCGAKALKGKVCFYDPGPALRSEIWT
jgi:hypothetical protein